MSKKKRRKVLFRLLLGAVILILGVLTQFAVYRYTHNRSALFKTEGSRLQIYRDKKWREFTVKGVALEPAAGYSSAAAGTAKDEYVRWFKQIAAMNANVIRIQTILSPDFYQALYEYNMLARWPLYLLQGIWVKDSGNESWLNAYDDRLNNDFYEEIRRAVDVIHGKGSFKRDNSGPSLNYKLNIAPYVMGFILGKEMDADFVIATNEKNTQVKGFDGDYLYTGNASPYEAWLAAAGNYAVSYEQEKYGGPYRLVSWVNWPSTDPLVHRNESDSKTEELSGVDFEHIYATEKFSAGIFASYSVFPNLFKYQSEYLDYRDGSGKPNYYEGYLSELKRHHTMPVLAAEFGIPVSRGNGGTYTEKEQGEAVVNVFESIINAGFAGGIVYAWDDTKSDQGYGLLALEGEGGSSASHERLKDSYAVIQEKFAEY